MSISVKTKLGHWLYSLMQPDLHQEITNLIAERFSTAREVLRHKVPEREPKNFDYENRS